jgi:ferrous iron transport protein A
MLRPGHAAVVAGVRGGRGLVRRLSEMGLVPGTEVIVVSSHMRGPMVLKVLGSKLMLGRGMAHKILVDGA